MIYIDLKMKTLLLVKMVKPGIPTKYSYQIIWIRIKKKSGP